MFGNKTNGGSKKTTNGPKIIEEHSTQASLLEQDLEESRNISLSPTLIPKNYPDWSVNALIVGMVVLVFSLMGTLLTFTNIVDVDITGLIIFVFVAAMAELLSIEIYIKNTTVSTSVAPLLGGSLLFGPVGSIVLGVAVALSSWIKHRNLIQQFAFNASNHMIGSLLCAGLVLATGSLFNEWPISIQLILSLVAATIIYISTTGFLATVIGFLHNRTPISIWRERFRWLAPYYLAVGVVAHALIFSYDSAGLIGILVILVPLLMLRFSEKQYIDHTKDMVEKLKASNEELAAQANEITLLNEELLLTLAHSIDLRDPYVMEHSKNVSRYATAVAKELNLEPDRVELVRKAGLLHDIGKLGIPESILFKPSSLNDEEYKVVKEHVLIGAELIRGCHALHTLIPYVKHHHERFDGKGYPDGLSGEEIPLEARILGLADAVEAMASDRPYKNAFSPEEILEEVLRCSSTQFDPQIVEAFRHVMRKSGEFMIVNSARDVDSRENRNSNDKGLLSV